MYTIISLYFKFFPAFVFIFIGGTHSQISIHSLVG